VPHLLQHCMQCYVWCAQLSRPWQRCFRHKLICQLKATLTVQVLGNHLQPNKHQQGRCSILLWVKGSCV
jgi:hypothetical protein